MPIYEYYCPLCKKKQDEVHSITESPVFECNNCRIPLVKAFHAPGVAFKGSGWGHQSN